MTISTILFDFDNTLVDTRGMIKTKWFPELSRAMEQDQIDVEQTFQAYVDTLDHRTDFHRRDFAHFFVEKLELRNASAEDILNLIMTPNWYEEYVFSDAIPVLEQLASHYKLGLYTEAVEEFQYQNVINSGLLDWFEPELRFIRRRKSNPETLQELPPNSLIVDDSPIHLERISQTRPDIKPIWLNRAHINKNQFEPMITALIDLPRYINS